MMIENCLPNQAPWDITGAVVEGMFRERFRLLDETITAEVPLEDHDWKGWRWAVEVAAGEIANAGGIARSLYANPDGLGKELHNIDAPYRFGWLMRINATTGSVAISYLSACPPDVAFVCSAYPILEGPGGSIAVPAPHLHRKIVRPKS
jgi:hypothetical protein